MRISPPVTCSSAASGWSGICRGTSIERMPSCTVPIFSKIEVTLRATQPAMLFSCQASGMAVATAPMAICPADHCHSATAAIDTIRRAFISTSVEV